MQRKIINIHKYGAHIFHTTKREIWEYINQFCEFNHFINSPLANYKGEIYNLPFNMNTFAQIFATKAQISCALWVHSGHKIQITRI